jgi:EAL domain-containing protein (putative c-di-GMP-specific phosphodiesterase class I)/glycosyltransferase involved in cell wall biosynthesis
MISPQPPSPASTQTALSAELSALPLPSDHSSAATLLATMTTMFDITVVIPTYNGAKRLPALLQKLRSQHHHPTLQWEIIVCDNNSTDETAQVVRQYQHTWPTQVPLRYCFAAEQGAAFARQHAVESARGSLIAFLDDDNLPEPDWVEQVYQFGQHYPQAGVFGSQIHGKFEGKLPEGFDQIACFLAIIERGDKPHRYEPKSRILPPAAGLAVRKEAWLNAVPKRLFLNNKGKEAGLASEDLEAILHIQKSGWEVWYNPAMVVNHDIPDSRLQEDYLRTLIRCVGLSRFYIRLLGTKDWQRPFAIPAYIANDLRRLALSYLPKNPPDTRPPLVKTIERERLSSSVASPVFLLKKACRDAFEDCLNQIRLDNREQWLHRLAQAFEDNRFALYEQSVVSIHTESSASATQPLTQKEVLLRLIEPAAETGIISPGQFMAVAERSGLAKTLDRWVIRQCIATLQAANVRLNFQTMAQPLLQALSANTYSINLSKSSIQDPSFLSFIGDQLMSAQLPPALICFEISESAALAIPQETRQLIHGLHELGCQVILDDFSLKPGIVRALDRLPVDFLKIDAHLFVSPHSPKNILLALNERRQIQLPQSALTYIAKGIETQPLLKLAQQVGILYAQGFQVEKPHPLAIPVSP